MADIKWIKIATEIFDNRKIKQIENLPDGDSIIVIWFKLLCLAGNINDNGMVYFTQEIPYTEQMLAAQFNRPLSTVQMSLRTFEKFGMVEIINDILKISNWVKYQNIEKMNEIREYNRLAQQRHRAALKAASETNAQGVNDKSMTSQPCQDTDIDIDINIDIDIDSEEDGENTRTVPQAECPFAKIRDLYHSICISYPTIKAIDGSRRKDVADRWSANRSLDTFEELFRKAEASPFLKGQNDSNWSADFDWIMRPENFAKVLEGKYDKRNPKKEEKPEKEKGSFNTADFFKAAVNRRAT